MLAKGAASNDSVEGGIVMSGKLVSVRCLLFVLHICTVLYHALVHAARENDMNDVNEIHSGKVFAVCTTRITDSRVSM